jgi:tRNA (guanine-N7-)-methyltransferase
MFDELGNCFQFDELVADAVIARRLQPTKQSSQMSSGLLRSARNDNAIVEIGAGTGLLSVELARRHPENFYIAVDIKSDRLYTGAKLATELGLENVIFIRSSTDRLPEILPAGSVSEIWITFPDPYLNDERTGLKKSDAKHRLTSPKYLNIYQQLLLQQGPSLLPRLHFKTDSELLFDWSVEQLEQSGWKIIEQSRDLHGSDLPEDYKIKTSYEKRFSEQGLPIFYLTATMDV